MLGWVCGGAASCQGKLPDDGGTRDLAAQQDLFADERDTGDALSPDSSPLQDGSMSQGGDGAVDGGIGAALDMREWGDMVQPWGYDAAARWQSPTAGTCHPGPGALLPPMIPGRNLVSIASADLDLDGRTDFVVSADELQAYWNRGQSQGVEQFNQSNYSTGGLGKVSLQDLNNDTLADVILAESAGYEVYLNRGNGVIAPPILYPDKYLASSEPAFGDVNADGFVDLLTATAIYLNNGDGTFSTPSYFDTPGRGNCRCQTADIDGDGWPDIISGTGTRTQICVNLNGSEYYPRKIEVRSNRGGLFVLTYRTALPPYAELSAVADFNRDGLIDVFVSNPETIDYNNRNGILLGDGRGGFGSISVSVQPPPSLTPLQQSGICVGHGARRTQRLVGASRAVAQEWIEREGVRGAAGRQRADVDELEVSVGA